jgi:O-antigen/teichoic acid export membrane protein
MLKKFIIQLHQDILFRNSFYLMVTTGVMAGLGFFFWLINAHLFTTAEIGLATTLISAMSLIALFSLIGFNAAFIRFLPTASDKSEQMNTGLLLVSGASGILSLLFITFLPFISPQLLFIRENPLYAIAFVIACVMNSLNTLTDSIFLGSRDTKYILITDGLGSLIKMFAPFAFIGWGAIGIFTAAAVGQTFGTILSIIVMMRRFDYRPALEINFRFLKSVWRYSVGNYISSILNLLPVTVLPLIIINYLGADNAAYYYIAMMIANLLYAIPYSMTRSLFAEGSHDETSVAENLKKSIKLLSFLLIPSILVLIFGGGLILHVFGKSYSSGGLVFLQLLALSAITVSAYSFSNSIFQISKNVSAVIIVNIIYAGSVIGLSYLFLPLGLTGIGIAWLLGNALSGAVGYILHRWGAFISVKWDNLTHERRQILYAKRLYLRAGSSKGFQPKTVLFYPDRPRVWHIIYHICHQLGYKISTDLNGHFDIAMTFEDITVRRPDPVREALARKTYLINAHCDDISKEYVEQVLQEVFGYSMAIDPRTYTGAYVRKSNLNAQHDGKVLHEPSEPEAGYIYQKLIDSDNRGKAYDIRTLIFKENIPFTIYRYKNLQDRFNTTSDGELVETDNAFSKEEQEKIIRFCKKIGLDYGELDILRDKNDNRIYIVDANNTPSGPVRGKQLPIYDYDRFLDWLAKAFAQAFAGEQK